MNKYKLTCFIALIAAAPSVIIGAIAMRSNNVPRIIYVQNIVCLFAGWLISCFIISRIVNDKKSKNIKIIIFILILYILTFIDTGIGGVHRWVSLGPIRLYISSIFVPALIIGLWEQLQKKKELFVLVITATVSILIIYQPDASQLTAFCIPMMIMIFSKVNNKIYSYTVIILLALLVVISWMFLDSLPPVIYVEEIVSLLMRMGLAWFILGITSLTLLPLPFVLLPREGYNLLSRCIGLYFVIVIFSTYFGNFPVPMMGYGISPIIGYLAAINWLLKPRIISQN